MRRPGPERGASGQMDDPVWTHFLLPPPGRCKGPPWLSGLFLEKTGPIRQKAPDAHHVHRLVSSLLRSPNPSPASLQGLAPLAPRAASLLEPVPWEFTGGGGCLFKY